MRALIATSLALLGALVLLGAGQPQSASSKLVDKSAFDKSVLEDYVRHLFVWGPEINISVSDPQPAPVDGLKKVVVTGQMGKVSQDEVFYVSNDGHEIIRGSIYDVRESPFAADLKLLKTDMQPSFGTPGAPVVIVFFSDFECPACAGEAKIIRGQLRTQYFDKVRVYFKDFPLDAIHPWARSAAIAGRCVFQQQPAGFWDYFDWIYGEQENLNAANLRGQVLDFATRKGWDTQKLAACIDTKATEPEVDASVAEARALKLNSTPTVFVNGRRLPGIEWRNLKAIIDFEVGYQERANNAGEKCCEVTIASPVQK